MGGLAGVCDGGVDAGDGGDDPEEQQEVGEDVGPFASAAAGGGGGVVQGCLGGSQVGEVGPPEGGG
ncbi:hypothetical protein GCM10027614_08060 [Micromonospora vulcania]